MGKNANAKAQGGKNVEIGKLLPGICWCLMWNFVFLHIKTHELWENCPASREINIFTSPARPLNYDNTEIDRILLKVKKRKKNDPSNRWLLTTASTEISEGYIMCINKKPIQRTLMMKFLHENADLDQCELLKSRSLYTCIKLYTLRKLNTISAYVLQNLKTYLYTCISA